MFAGHGYGRRTGRGNRYRHDYDDAMLDYMVKEQLALDKNNLDPMWRTPRAYAYGPHSQNELFRIIRDRCDKGVSKQTVIEHLDGLVEDHFLEKCAKAGERNMTFYWLSRTELIERTSFQLIAPDETVISNPSISFRVTIDGCAS